jgi:hypothetical protein
MEEMKKRFRKAHDLAAVLREMLVVQQANIYV